MRVSCLTLGLLLLTTALFGVFCGPRAPENFSDWSERRASLDRRMEGLLQTGSFEEALRLADSLLAGGAADARVKGQRARSLAGLGRNEQATSAFEDALLADYEDCYNHLEFAGFLMRIGKTGRAHTEYMEAKNFCEESQFPLIYRNLAVASIKLGRQAEARQYVGDGLLAAPDDPYLLGLKGMLVAKENPVEAESLFVAALAGRKLSKDFLVQYGLLLLNGGRPAEAARAFERAREVDPANREVRADLAEAYDRSGRGAEAEEILGALIAERDDPALRARLARALFHEERYEEALEVYRGLEKTPEVKDRIAMCLHNLGREEEALVWAREAVAAKRDWPQGMANLAVILGAKGELEEAQRLLERVLELEPDNVAARVNLERLREAAGKRPGAEGR